MVFLGLSHALLRAPSFETAVGYSSTDADFSLAEGLNAPLLASLKVKVLIDWLMVNPMA